MRAAWFELGDAGRDYLRGYLRSGVEWYGGRLGAGLLDRGAPDTFAVHALAPEHLTVAELTAAFDAGGVMPTRAVDYREQAVARVGAVLTPRDDGPARGLWREDGLGRPGDGWIAGRPETETIFFGADSVFEHVDADGDVAGLLDRCTGAPWCPDLAVVAPAPAALRPPPRRGDVDAADIAALASTAELIVIGAFDNEGLLFCEPALGAA